MSLETTYNDSIRRKKEELIKLKNYRAKYINDLTSLTKKIERANNQLKAANSQSTIKSKINEINREEKKQSDIQKRISEIDSKIVKKEKELGIEERKLLQEQEKNRRKRDNELNNTYSQLQNAINIQKYNTAMLSEEIKRMKSPKTKINILFLGANPDIVYQDGTEQSKLKLDKEAREIKEALTKSLNRDSINFETRWAVRTSDLFQAINEVNPTIIHLTNKLKPWNDINAVKSNEFWKYADNIDVIKYILSNNRNTLNQSYNEKISFLEEKSKLPKWLGNLICGFIPGKKNRHNFRKKYIKNN